MGFLDSLSGGDLHHSSYRRKYDAKTKLDVTNAVGLFSLGH